MRNPIKKTQTSTAFRVKIQNANALRDDGKFAEAAEAYRDALKVNPKHAGAWGQLGNMLKDSRQYSEAQIAYETALELKESADTYLQLGHLFKLAGNMQKSISYYEKALALDKNSHDAFVALSQLNPSSPILTEMGFNPQQMVSRAELRDLMSVVSIKLSDRKASFNVRARG